MKAVYRPRHLDGTVSRVEALHLLWPELPEWERELLAAPYLPCSIEAEDEFYTDASYRFYGDVAL